MKLPATWVAHLVKLFYLQTGTQHSCVTVKTGPKEDTKRVAITSERGERGGITKCATHVAANFVAVAN